MTGYIARRIAELKARGIFEREIDHSAKRTSGSASFMRSLNKGYKKARRPRKRSTGRGSTREKYVSTT